MENPDLCVVIPTFNRKKQLLELLIQLKQQKAGTLKVAIVVVVDGSTDGTMEMLQSDFPEVYIIKGDGNWWFTRSMNEGCKYAVDVLGAKLIITSNDDLVLPNDEYFLRLHKNYVDCGGNCVIGSVAYSLSEPRMITFSGIERQSMLTLKNYNYIKPYTVIKPETLKGVKPSVTLSTRGMLIESSILQKINYLDEKTFPQYASDYDVVLRAGRAGAKIYVSYDAYILENMDLTSDGNPRLTKSLSHYLKNIFFNKYSSNYFFNVMHMSWRFGIKLLFPLYFFNAVLSIAYVYIKYKFFLNKKIQNN